MECVDNKQEGIREDRIGNVSYLVYESTQARAERTIKRLIIALIMTIILLFLSNVLWIRYINQFDMETISYAQDGTGLNSINLGSQGDVRYEPGINYTEAETEEAQGN